MPVVGSAAPAEFQCGNPVSYDWAAQSADRAVEPFAIGGVTVEPKVGAQGNSRIWVTDETLSGDAGYVAFFHPGADEGKSTGLELTFDHPVRGLEFELLDVDAASEAFRDVVRVRAFDGVDDITESVTAQVGVAARASADADGTFQGVATSDNDADLSNVELAVAGPVTRLVVSHVDGGGPNGRLSGIGDISICGPQVGGALAIHFADEASPDSHLRLRLVIENLGGVPLEAVTFAGSLGQLGVPVDSVPDAGQFRLDFSPSEDMRVAADGTVTGGLPADEAIDVGTSRAIEMAIELPADRPATEGVEVQFMVTARSALDGAETTDLTDGGDVSDINANGDPSEAFEQDPTAVPFAERRSEPPFVPAAIATGVIAAVAMWRLRLAR